MTWLRAPKLDPRVLKFQELCAGKFIPGSSAMIFVAQSACGDSVRGYIPQYIYAAKLRGFGKTVDDTAEAQSCFEKPAPAFPRLE